MIKELKEKLIHWLGGYTLPIETNVISVSHMKITPFACSMVITDKIPIPEEYIKRDIAHKLGEGIVDSGCVEYSSEPCEYGTKLIAKIYIGVK